LIDTIGLYASVRVCVCLRVRFSTFVSTENMDVFQRAHRNYSPPVHMTLMTF